MRAEPIITNAHFLAGIFGEAWRRAHVAGVFGDPAETRAGWHGGRAELNVFRFTRTHNTYYAISLFRPDKLGAARRRKDLFEATYVIVVDDVGQKVEAGGVLARLGRPSYRLETSPGNEQWGYILAEPATNAEQVEALLDGLVANGLTPDGKDPGMTGVTRYARLPVGTNTKAKYGRGGFRHRLHEWKPSRRFTLQQLAAAYGVGLEAPSPRRAQAVTPRPSGGDDDVLAALYELGLVSWEDTAKGVVHIICPFVDEHTGRDETGTAYLGGGGFKCHHGHCRDRRTPDFLREIRKMLREIGKPGFFAQREFARDERKTLEGAREEMLATGGASDVLVNSLALVGNEDAVTTLVEGCQLFAPSGVDVDAAAILARIEAAREAWDRMAERAALSMAGQRHIQAGLPAEVPAGAREAVPLAEAAEAVDRALASRRAQAGSPSAPLRPLRRADRHR